MRMVIAALVVVGLAIAVAVLWPRSDDENAAGEATSTTSTSTTAPNSTTTTSTTVATSSTTSVLDDHVVETVEEAEEILRELWFGWFEGIHNQDEERIREVVATEHQLELALEQFETMTFDRPPDPADISYADTEILRSSNDCTAIWTTATFSGFTEGSSTDVHVLRWSDGWRFFSLWAFKKDLWEADCEADLG
jgi:hypothetical protein